MDPWRLKQASKSRNFAIWETKGQLQEKLLGEENNTKVGAPRKKQKNKTMSELLFTVY